MIVTTNANSNDVLTPPPNLLTNATSANAFALATSFTTLATQSLGKSFMVAITGDLANNRYRH